MGAKLSTKIINISFLILEILMIVLDIKKRLYYSVVGLVFILILYIVYMAYENKKGNTVSDFVRIAVIISILSNSFLGEYMELYNISLVFDKLLHVFGTFSFSVFIFSLVEKKGSFLGNGRVFRFAFVVLLGSFLGTMFEIGEYICDVLFKTVNQGSLADTDMDMICNTIGAAMAGIFVVLKKHLPKHV